MASHADRLTAMLKRIAPSLRQNKIVDAQYKRSNGKRLWIIERMTGG